MATANRRPIVACGYTDMRKGMDGLAMLAQQVLAEDPFGGALFAFRGKRGGLIKLLWFDGQGLCLFSKRLEKGHFQWPVTDTGRVSLTPAQLSMLLEGIDWRDCPRFRVRSAWNGRRGACPPVSAVRNWRADVDAHAGFIRPDSQRRDSVRRCPPRCPLCPRIRRCCSTCCARRRPRSCGCRC
jgi:transposase